MTMDLNHYLVKNNSFQVSIKTKLLSLLYSALSEAQFTQILHTPFGFRYSEILNIKNQNSLVKSWHLMLDIALKRVGDWNTNRDLKIRRAKLNDFIDEYIGEPQELRNKIAHGQWVYALNSNTTNENPNTTSRISGLDVVKITIWFEVHQYLCFIIRDLIQSPQKGFHNNYWINLANLEEFLEKSRHWTLEKRVKSLKVKFDNKKMNVHDLT